MRTCVQCGRWSAHTDQQGRCRICQVPGVTDDVLLRYVTEWVKATPRDQAIADELESRAIVFMHKRDNRSAWD